MRRFSPLFARLLAAGCGGGKPKAGDTAGAPTPPTQADAAGATTTPAPPAETTTVPAGDATTTPPSLSDLSRKTSTSGRKAPRPESLARAEALDDAPRE